MVSGVQPPSIKLGTWDNPEKSDEVAANTRMHSASELDIRCVAEYYSTPSEGILELFLSTLVFAAEDRATGANKPSVRPIESEPALITGHGRGAHC
jgi:hypothetical protein